MIKGLWKMTILMIGGNDEQNSLIVVFCDDHIYSKVEVVWEVGKKRIWWTAYLDQKAVFVWLD